MMHAGGNRGVRELQQDVTASAGDHDHFAVDLPGDAAGPRPEVIGSKQAGAHGRAVLLNWVGSHVLFSASHLLSATDGTLPRRRKRCSRIYGTRAARSRPSRQRPVSGM